MAEGKSVSRKNVMGCKPTKQWPFKHTRTPKCPPSPQQTQEDYEGFQDELGREGMDVSQPDSKGHLPMIEAVRTHDIRCVNGVAVDAFSCLHVCERMH